jgi:Ribosomal RNA large subunit methyltransferase D, RlmJ/DNA methylase
MASTAISLTFAIGFTVARDLLGESGSIFLQIGDENVHLARALLEEVFGKENFISQITIAKTAGATSELLPGISDYILWFAKNLEAVKYRQTFQEKSGPDNGAGEYKYVVEADGRTRPLSKDEKSGTPLPIGADLYRPSATTSQRPPGSDPFPFQGLVFSPGPAQFWKTSVAGLARLGLAGRLIPRKASISYLRRLRDFPVMRVNNLWLDTRWGFDAQDKRYVVETNTKVVARCLLMATDPGDLVLDPTCGAGTTATVAEQWGRRWITIDTSRVALALARVRIMGARYPFLVRRPGALEGADVHLSTSLSAFVPPRQRRGLVFVDPSFERPDEFEAVAEALNAGVRKWPTGIYAFWYPVKGRSEISRLRKRLQLEEIPTLCTEFLAYAKNQEGLTGSGLVVFNPPWRFEKDVTSICRALAPIFESSGSGYSTEWWTRPR